MSGSKCMVSWKNESLTKLILCVTIGHTGPNKKITSLCMSALCQVLIL